MEPRVLQSRLEDLRGELLRAFGSRLEVMLTPPTASLPDTNAAVRPSPFKYQCRSHDMRRTASILRAPRRFCDQNPQVQESKTRTRISDSPTSAPPPPQSLVTSSGAVPASYNAAASAAWGDAETSPSLSWPGAPGRFCFASPGHGFSAGFGGSGLLGSCKVLEQDASTKPIRWNR